MRPSRRETLLLLSAFGLLVLLRVLTLARDPWEWDEVLFMQAAREGLDVRVQHPHAPGYPGFVYPARLLVLLGASPFASVTAVGAFGGLLSVVAVFVLALALGLARRRAALAAGAYALLPAVWLHGVRPLGDGLGAAAVAFALAAIAASIRTRSERSLALAALCCGVAASVRPQAGVALLPAALVAAASVWREGRRAAPLARAAALGLATAALFWVPAIHGSGGVAPFVATLKAQFADFRIDQPTLHDFLSRDFWSRWLVDPLGGRDAAIALWGAAACAFLAAPRRALAASALYAPLGVLTILTLDPYVAPRYALAFLPLPALLLAMTVEALGRTRATMVATPAASLILGAIALPAVPAIAEVHERPSPSVALMRALRDDPRFRGRPVELFPTLVVHAHEYLRGRVAHELVEGIPAAPDATVVIAWTDGEALGQKPVWHAAYRNNAMLRRISRDRYLTASIYDTGNGASVPVPFVTPPGWWEGRHEGLAALGRPGIAMEVRSAGPAAWVACTVASDIGVTLRVTTAGGRHDVTYPAGRHPLEVRAKSAPGVPLVRYEVLAGRTDLTAFRIISEVPPPEERPVPLLPAKEDPLLTGWLDSLPPDGVVHGDMEVRGWCQQAPDRACPGVLVFIDQRLVTGAVTRVRRDDVCNAIKSMTNCDRAGFVVPVGRLAPGAHTLSAVIVSESDTWRRIGPWRFRWEP